MKIVKFTAENVKRLKAVEIDPDGTVQVITGRNAQGKTSVLDAIWLALGGRAALRDTARPIRDGEDTATVTLDLGDHTVTRTWRGDKTTLHVTSADGARYSSPQAMLDALVGRLSFDPLEFTRLSSREQVAALLDIVDLDIDPAAMAAMRQRLFENRTDVGRRAKAFGAAPPVNAFLPTTEVSASQLINEITAAQRAAEDQSADLAFAASRRDLIADLEEKLKNAREQLVIAEERVAQHEVLPDVDMLREQLAGIEDRNVAIRENNAARHRRDQLAELHASYDGLTRSIESLDEEKARALAAATFPVPGLGFDDSGVTYQGVPFSQASSAEQIRVSLAMAMSLNPTLRVIRILDGSLLDTDSLALIADMAADRDYQVWIERVADGSGIGVVIEDGQVQP